VERFDNQVDLTGTINSIATWLTGAAGSILKGSLVQLVGVLLTFYLLFFFLRDRRAALQFLRKLSPLSHAEMDRMFTRVSDTIYATIYGTLAVGAVQGFLGGLMFWWLGLPAPLLWGVVMAVLSVVPVLGAFVVWIPAALFLCAEGSWVKGVGLRGWGAGVVGTVDNLLRPVLVGKRLKLHTLLMFISLVGGLLVFGAAGIVLGPVILTMTIVLLEVWRARSPGVPKAEAD
jgi:predicted PurR-regulated permease PerM